MPSLAVGGRRIEYSVVRGRSAHYTYFRFRPDLTLEVAVPTRRRVDVEAEIRAKQRWVLNEAARLASIKPVLGDDYVMYGGVANRLAFVQGANEALAHDPSNSEVTVRAADRRRVREMVRRWFLKETSAYVVRKVSELAPVVGVRPSRVDTREIGKWGYCTVGGRLTFSSQLVALPGRLREYVVLHELTHLAVFDHSQAFRRRLGALCPDRRSLEKELDSYLPYDRFSPP